MACVRESDGIVCRIFSFFLFFACLCQLLLFAGRINKIFFFLNSVRDFDIGGCVSVIRCHKFSLRGTYSTDLIELRCGNKFGSVIGADNVAVD